MVWIEEALPNLVEGPIEIQWNTSKFSSHRRRYTVREHSRLLLMRVGVGNARLHGMVTQASLRLYRGSNAIDTKVHWLLETLLAAAFEGCKGDVTMASDFDGLRAVKDLESSNGVCVDDETRAFLAALLTHRKTLVSSLRGNEVAPRARAEMEAEIRSLDQKFWQEGFMI
jgi:hypothetical protein